MNSLIDINRLIKLPRGLLLAIVQHNDRDHIGGLIARMALRGPLYVLAGSEWLPAYGVARTLRHKTSQLKQTLGRIRMARAFTCYQLFDLLTCAAPDHEPVLMLDFLHTFHNPDVPLPVRFRLLRQCCEHLQRLSFYKPVIVLIQETPAPEYEQFLPLLASIADEILRADSAHIAESQPGLF